MRNHMKALLCTAFLAACGEVQKEAQSVSFADRFDAVGLAKQLRQAAQANEVYTYRTLLFREHVRAQGDSTEQTKIALVDVIRDAGVHGFDGVEPLILFYYDTLVAKKNQGYLQEVYTAFQDAGGVQFQGPAPQFLAPILRSGTGYVPSTAFEILRILLELAGRTPPDELGQTTCSMSQTDKVGGYEALLDEDFSRDEICGALPSGTHLGDQVRNSEYCKEPEGLGCGALGTAAIGGMSAATCIDHAVLDEFQERSDSQNAWIDCSRSAVDEVNQSFGENGAPNGNGTPNSGNTSGDGGCNCNCSCAPPPDGGTRPDSGSGGSRPSGSNGNRPDSGTGNTPAGGGNNSTGAGSDGDQTDETDQTNNGQTVTNNGKGTIVNINIFSFNNTDADSNTESDDSAGEPSAPADSGGFVSSIKQVLDAIFTAKKAGGAMLPSDFVGPSATTEECDAFMNEIAAALDHRRVNVPSGEGQPWNDPRTAYPPMDSNDAARSLDGIEACGADSASHSEPGVCGLVSCGAGFLSSTQGGAGGLSNCCGVAATDSAYEQFRAMEQELCEAVILCPEGVECCAAPTAETDAPSPRPPPILVDRFFTRAHDTRRMASDKGQSAYYLSGMEEMILRR